jgi:hypothetical protein
MLEGENGLLMPALKVFSESIKYLRGHLENHLHSKQGIGGFQASEVDWVLTVRRKLCFYYTCKFGVISIKYVIIQYNMLICTYKIGGFSHELL